MAEIGDNGWNGADGRHWAHHHERYDAMAEGFDRHLFAAAALTETSRVLDIGCGTGQTSRSAARRCLGGHVVGIDISAPMLACARELAAADAIRNLSFIQGDAQVHPLERNHFDVAISRAGVMDFADPVSAFTNICAAIRPGGHLVFISHREAAKVLHAVYATVLDPAVPGVAQFADAEQVSQILSAAGLVDVTATPVDTVAVVGRNALDATDFLLDGPLRDLEGEGGQRARAAVLQAMRACVTPDGVHLPAHGWMFTATKPRV